MKKAYAISLLYNDVLNTFGGHFEQWHVNGILILGEHWSHMHLCLFSYGTNHIFHSEHQEPLPASIQGS